MDQLAFSKETKELVDTLFGVFHRDIRVEEVDRYLALYPISINETTNLYTLIQNHHSELVNLKSANPDLTLILDLLKLDDQGVASDRWTRLLSSDDSKFLVDTPVLAMLETNALPYLYGSTSDADFTEFDNVYRLPHMDHKAFMDIPRMTEVSADLMLWNHLSRDRYVYFPVMNFLNKEASVVISKPIVPEFEIINNDPSGLSFKYFNSMKYNQHLTTRFMNQFEAYKLGMVVTEWPNNVELNVLNETDGYVTLVTSEDDETSKAMLSTTLTIEYESTSETKAIIDDLFAEDYSDYNFLNINVNGSNKTIINEGSLVSGWTIQVVSADKKIYKFGGTQVFEVVQGSYDFDLAVLAGYWGTLSTSSTVFFGLGDTYIPGELLGEPNLYIIDNVAYNSEIIVSTLTMGNKVQSVAKLLEGQTSKSSK